MGVSARHLGQFADAFRPSGTSQPLAKENRFLRLPAVFISPTGKEQKANTYGEPLCYGVFDASYTRPGDYLVGGSRTFFVASQDPLMPVLCVRTNSTVSIARPTMQTGAAGNSYGGYTAGRSTILIDKWPASVLGDHGSGTSAAGLPTDQSLPTCTVLIPAIPGLILAPGDILTDELGRIAVVAASELSNLGWRMTARIATT